MALRDRIAALVSVAPPDATVTVEWLAELLAADGAGDTAAKTRGAVNETTVDLTVHEVAARFGKGESTVRTWLARDELPGAYRLHGREWRIPAASVEALQRAQQAQHRTIRRAAPTADATDLSAWRRHLPGAANG